MTKTVSSTGVISKELFVKALPKQCKNNITDEVVANINNVLFDEVAKEAFRDNLLSYTSVMMSGKFKIGSYVDAIKFVSFKLLGSSNEVSYLKAFPQRYQRLLDLGKNSKEISSYVAAYNKSILVQKILEQTLTPNHVLNADLYQKALNKQAELIMNPDVSYKVQSDAANSLLVHLKPPETTKIELDIGLKENDVIDDLRKSTMELVKQQRLAIESGAMGAKEIAHSKVVGNIIEGTLVN